MRTSLVGLALALGSGRSPAPALAQSETFNWTSAPTCLNETTATAALDALLGDAWLTPDLSIAVELAASDGGFSLVVRTLLEGESSERTLWDPSCEALSEAGILVVALAIRPELELGPGDRELLDRLLGRVPESETPPPAVEQPQPVKIPAPIEPTPPGPGPEAEPLQSPPPRASLTGAMTLRAGLGWGMLPTLEGGPIAGGALILPRARVEVDGRGWFGPAATTPTAATVALSGWALAARGGPSWTAGPVVLPLMLGTEVGQLIGRPAGLRDPVVQRPTWWALTATFGVVYSPFERLGLTAMLEGFVAVSRPSFSVEGYPQDVHTPREGGIRALLGVEARLGR